MINFTYTLWSNFKKSKSTLIAALGLIFATVSFAVDPGKVFYFAAGNCRATTSTKLSMAIDHSSA